MLTSLILVHSIVLHLSVKIAAFTFFRRNLNPLKSINFQKIAAVSSMLLQFYMLYFYADLTLWRCVLAEVLLVLASVVFLWALKSSQSRLSEIYSTDLPVFINRKGAYDLVRHPFYTSYLLMYLAGACVTPPPALLIQTLVMFAFYYNGARFEEGKFAESELRDQYNAYKNEVGMFFPKLFRPSKQA